MSGIPEAYSMLLSYYLDKNNLGGTLTPNVKRIDEGVPYFSYYIYLVSYTYKR